MERQIAATDAQIDRLVYELYGLTEDEIRQQDLLHRAQTYAQAALRDFQHYQGRAAADEAKAQQLLADIAQALKSAGGRTKG